jgi:hypothetical protein
LLLKDARSEEPKVTAEAAIERIVRNLDSDYHKAELHIVVAKATQELNKQQTN